MHLQRTGRAVAAVLMVAAVAGCGAEPASSSPTTTEPQPSPTYTCTPQGGKPYACTGAQYTEQEKQKVLVDSARRVFTRYFNESARLYRSGGASSATAELKATTSGAYLKAKQAEFAQLKRSGVKATGGDIKIVRLQPDPEAAAKGFEVGLTSCIDATTVQLNREGEAAGRKGFAVAGTVYLKRDGGVLKIADAEERSVRKC